MRYAIRHLGALTALALLGSCGTGDNGGLETAPGPVTVAKGVSDEPVKIGESYTIGNTTYTPADIAMYDEVGFASHYGAELAGKPTANGETFNPAGASAAHRTLPLPSYVEVTALDTGRTILVRVNDRGPFSNDRLIDLSDAAARQLGITTQGVAGVRVRRVNPPEQEKEVLRQGLTAAERIETPEPLLKVLRDKLAKQPKAVMVPSAEVPPSAKVAAATNPAPVKSAPPKTAPAPPIKAVAKPVAVSAGDYVVQVAALSSRSRADALARKLGASVTATADGRLFRVRYGPYPSEAAAQQGLATAKAKGYPQARVYRD